MTAAVCGWPRSNPRRAEARSLVTGAPVKQERDHLPQIGAVAAQQVVTLRAYDLLHPLQGAFHEVPDHAGRTIEHALDQPDVVGQAQVIVTQACHAPT